MDTIEATLVDKLYISAFASNVILVPHTIPELNDFWLCAITVALRLASALSSFRLYESIRYLTMLSTVITFWPVLNSRYSFQIVPFSKAAQNLIMTTSVVMIWLWVHFHLWSFLWFSKLFVVDIFYIIWMNRSNGLLPRTFRHSSILIKKMILNKLKKERLSRIDFKRRLLGTCRTSFVVAVLLRIYASAI